MIIPELPSYLTNLGGGEYKGLIISLFTLTALISRPFSGKLADQIGRVPVMMFGSFVCVICSFCYPVLTGVSGFLLLRLVHGFSTGFTPTGLTAYLADIIPASKRGEAMGILGTAGTIGMALGPAVGGAVANNFSLDVMFYCSSFFAIASITILFTSKETLTDKKRFSHTMLKLHKKELLERSVMMPCIVMVLHAYGYGAMYTVMPDFGEFVGIRNKGLLFTYLTVASLLVRMVAGKASDVYGRKNVLKVSMFLMCIGMVVIGTAKEDLQLAIGTVIYGLANGMTSPTLFAWVTDLSHDHNKGKAISTLYMFMEFGIGVGALASGFIFSNNTNNFFITFMVCAVLVAMAFIYLLMLDKKKSMA
ncbi:MAG: MFS transporter [Flammeovirgaceae bacterium]|nr:MFS transporter [Flammeovirgaceae bacterium]